jgi:ribonuclease HI
MKMGYGWQRISEHSNDFLTSYNASIQNWPSSTRAETAALYSAILTLPRPANMDWYTDSQAAIDTLRNIQSGSARSITQYLKRPNYILWSCIKDRIDSHEIHITPHKVKAHAEDYINNHTDKLAKQGAESNVEGLPNLAKTTPIRYTVAYKENLIEKDLRHFITEINDAKRFNELLMLKRFEHITHLHSLTKIDWKATWDVISKATYPNGQYTSPEDASMRSFKMKLFFDELPTLERLKERKPNLYHKDWTCQRCATSPKSTNTPKEYMDHVWTCSGNIGFDSQQILDQGKSGLADHLAKIDPKYNRNDIYTRLSSLRCWNLAYRNHDVTAYELLRGFIPYSLSNIVKDYSKSTNSTSTILTNFMKHLHKSLKKNVWNARNEHFTQIEKQLIDTKQKLKPHVSQMDTELYNYEYNPNGSSTQHAFNHKSHTIWVNNAIKYGYSWTDF